MDRAYEKWMVNGSEGEAQTYDGYCRQVCAVLKKATKKEKAALTRELQAHMEDHVEALVELGWDPQEAMGYAVEAMGDPVTVGRQYDEKLSSMWLWCGYVFRMLCVAMAALLLLNVGLMFQMVKDNLQARWTPEKYVLAKAYDVPALVQKEQDIQILSPSGKYVIRIYQTEIYYDERISGYVVDVSVVSYPRNVLEEPGRLLGYASLEGVRGGIHDSSSGASYCRISAHVEKGQESVLFTIIREETGTDIRVEIPLDWKEVP